VRTIAILPIKSFSQAKQRLRGEVPAPLREALVKAMLEDVLSALAHASSIAEVVVVAASGPSGEAARAIARRSGAEVIADRGEGHNQAARMGIAAARRRGAERVLLVPGDCPAVEARELDELLASAAPPPGLTVVPDRHGTGTNALVISPPGVLGPAFGPGSCARHQELARRAGIACRVCEVPSLALDVDTPEDLMALASAADAAPRTLALLSRC